MKDKTTGADVLRAVKSVMDDIGLRYEQIWVIPCQINQFFAKFARPPSDFDEIWHT